MFEDDKNITNEVKHQFRNESDTMLLSKLYPLTVNDGYTPYCEIYLDGGCNLKQSVSTETCSLVNQVGSNSLLIYKSSYDFLLFFWLYIYVFYLFNFNTTKHLLDRDTVIIVVPKK